MEPDAVAASRLHQAKNYPAAERLYRQVLVNDPANARIHFQLGTLLSETGRHEPAIVSFRTALQTQPNRPEIHQMLVRSLLSVQQLPGAIHHAMEVTRLMPMSSESHRALGLLRLNAGDYAGAIAPAKKAVELAPHSAGTRLLLGQLLSVVGQLPQAMVEIDTAISIDPKLTDAIVEKGIIFREMGFIEQAIANYETAMRLNPNHLPAINNAGACYLLSGKIDDAMRSFERAAELAPTLAQPRNNIGTVWKQLGRLDEAMIHFQRALQLDPEYGEAASNLGATLSTLGRSDEALIAFEHALKVKPSFISTLSNLLMMRISMPDIEPAALLAQHLEFGRRYADPLAGEIKPVEMNRKTDRPLRIGYVSPDFREHSIRYFIEPVIAGHDRSAVTVVGYSNGTQRDEITDRIAGQCDEWHRITGLSDESVAELIRSHAIDLLVDLAGHTSENRLLVFARRPAPVQVTYLGYPATTGLSTIDYRLTDAITDPPGTDRFHAEKLFRLNGAFFVFKEDEDLHFNPVLPLDQNGSFTFGSFNDYRKISVLLLEAWAEILVAIPNSRLLMKARTLDNASTLNFVRDVFNRRGVAPDRLELRGWVGLAEHHQMLADTDLTLDSFPYNGHTTTCQSIWMGTPVLTWAGDSFRSRVGMSILQRLDLADFITTSRDQYIERAIQLAKDPSRLRSLRPTLRQRMATSPLCDAPQFCRNLENAYRQMWEMSLNR